MTMLPEIISSIGDITKLGVEYSMFSPASLGGGPNLFAEFPMEIGDTKLIMAKVVMKTVDDSAHGAYEIMGMFYRDSFSIVCRKDVAPYVDRQDPNEFLYFDSTSGTSVKIIGSSGQPQASNWSGIISIISI